MSTKIKFAAISKVLKASAIILVTLSAFSCKTIPSNHQPAIQQELSRNLIAKGKMSASQLANYFISQNPNENYEHIKKFAQIYIDEASAEGINSDVAFAQMCHETGYLKFGNLVKREWHNYCGLGAMDAQHPGEKFATEQLGIRAHIQHLQAYATTEDIKLKKELIDPRYNWVHKTKYTDTIFGLSGTWATDPEYAHKIEQKLQDMETNFWN